MPNFLIKKFSIDYDDQTGEIINTLSYIITPELYKSLSLKDQKYYFTLNCPEKKEQYIRVLSKSIKSLVL